jgi:alkylhydroperoxidase family enzyme
MTDFTLHSLTTASDDAKPILEKVHAKYGTIPGLIAVMAEAPSLLKAYMAVSDLFADSSFDADELTVVWQTINVENNCHFCVPAHTAIAKQMGVEDAISNALRDETALPTPRLEALRTFTLAMVRERGVLDAATLDAFIAAGFTKQNMLEVVLGYSQKVMSNYTNHLADTPVDEMFQPFAWTKK